MAPTNLPANYIAARRALAAAHRVDQVKNIRKGVSGVYIFRNTQDVFYIGEARCLRRRLASHERARQLWTVPDIYLAIIPCSNHKTVERLLIKELAPLLNGMPAQQIRRPPPRSFDEVYKLLFGDSPWLKP